MKTSDNVPEPALNVPDNRIAPVWGLVLMGGRSTRMGQDKSALRYHGKPQREHLTDLLRVAGCKQVYWSVNKTQHNELTNSQMLPDIHPETGPLGGLLTAFDTYPDVAWLIVPCDLPRLDLGTLQTLLLNRNPTDYATAFRCVDGLGPEPLVSLWEPLVGPMLRTWFRAGNRSLRRFMMQHSVRLLNVPDARVFENVNDRADYLAQRGEQ